MYPYVDENKLNSVYINMDSNIFRKYKSKLKSEEQIKLAENFYVTSIYFHVIFIIQ